MHLKIVINPKKENAKELFLKIKERLKKDFDFSLEEGCAKRLNLEDYIKKQKPDFIISIGGDGTLIYASKIAGDIPILGVNVGSVGFLNEVEYKDFEVALEKLKKKEFFIQECMQIDAILNDKKFTAFNEIFIQKDIASKMVNIFVFINTIEVLNFRGDGIIISTPNGSTGYNLSAGGVILNPKLNAMIITPIFPYSLKQPKGIITSDEDIIVVKLEAEHRSLKMAVDCMQFVELKPKQDITLKVSEKKVKLIRFQEQKIRFYQSLSKLR